ncbi:MAG: hypothetical protein A3G34_05670 [Candidatus Lindowbacteria bacterium RIFCSPLOWO2_12_FULL_62_27]|nr:MAG: hypothetical protein A3G34_05670 [Candidatus Lindowbacteria bacterium RIFCSPLOWO2_12_FULL_62_27]
MNFKYRAAGVDGNVSEGTIAADRREDAFSALLARKLYPISIEAEQAEQAKRRRRKGSLSELAESTGELAKLLNAGLPLLSAVSEMEGLAESDAFREAWGDIKVELRGGASFSKALSAHPECFPPMVVGLVAAGEESGKLGPILERLGRYLDEMRTLRSELMSALIYPALMLIVGVLCVFFLVFFVLPKFATVFEDMQADLPLPTKALLSLSAHLQSAGPWLLIAAAAAVAGMWKMYQKPRVRLEAHRRALAVPLVGSLWQKVEAARIARTLSALLAGGLPVLRALDILKDIVQNLAMRARIAEAVDSVRAGRGVGESLASPVFPGLLLRLIAVGENTGNLADMLDRAAEVFEAQVRTRSKTLISLLEPAMIVGLAGVVGFIFAAVLLPMMRMGGG